MLCSKARRRSIPFKNLPEKRASRWGESLPIIRERIAELQLELGAQAQQRRQSED
jgi:hypothetical protein